MFAFKALTEYRVMFQRITHIKNKYCIDELVVLWFYYKKLYTCMRNYKLPKQKTKKPKKQEPPKLA